MTFENSIQVLEENWKKIGKSNLISATFQDLVVNGFNRVMSLREMVGLFPNERMKSE